MGWKGRPASGTRRASTPSWLPIQWTSAPPLPSVAATASPALVCPPVPPPAMTTRTPISSPGPSASGLDGGASPEASQRVTAPSGVAKSEAERPVALPPTPATETLADRSGRGAAHAEVGGR